MILCTLTIEYSQKNRWFFDTCRLSFLIESANFVIWLKKLLTDTLKYGKIFRWTVKRLTDRFHGRLEHG
jgi:hypothetical protein